MYLIKKGHVKISFGNDVVEIGREGCVLGEESLLGGLPRLANVTAVTDCIFVLIDKERLEILTGIYPLLLRQIHESIIIRRTLAL